MSIDWTTILTSVFSSAGTVGLIGYFFRHAFEAKIKVIAEHEINDHKHALDLHGDRIRHDLQRDMLQAQITIGQKHKIYAELYLLLMHAEGAVANLRGLRTEATYEEFSPEEFEDYLKSKEVKSEKRNEIATAFRDRKAKGVDLWRKYKGLMEKHAAQKKIADAKNVWLLNELYISDKVSKAVQDVTTKLSVRLISIEDPIPSEKSFEKDSNLESEIRRLMDEVKTLMRNELQPI